MSYETVDIQLMLERSGEEFEISLDGEKMTSIRLDDGDRITINHVVEVAVDIDDDDDDSDYRIDGDLK